MLYLMTYSLDQIATALKAAREEQGLSQRELGRRAGFPQAHISNIESGSVDLKVSSLIEIARALGLELMLVPRPHVPGVQALTGTSRAVPARAQRTPKSDLGRLAGMLRRWDDAPPPLDAHLDRLRRLTGDLAGARPDAEAADIVRVALKDVRRARKHDDPSQALRTAELRLLQLRDRLRHATETAVPVARPAYTLDTEDDDA